MAAKITVECSDVIRGGVSIGNHTFLVYTDDLGNEYVISPRAESEIPPFGNFISQVDEPMPTSVEAGRPNFIGARELDLGGRNASDVWQIMIGHANMINNNNISYDLLLNPQACNSVTASILHAVGLNFYSGVDSSWGYMYSSQRITGIDWGELAEHIERSHPFATASENFRILQSNPPGFLVIRNQKVEWKTNNATINTWRDFLISSFAQLRNNIAHGSKAHPSNNTTDRARDLIEAGTGFMTFIANDVLHAGSWEEPIVFR